MHEFVKYIFNYVNIYQGPEDNVPCMLISKKFGIHIRKDHHDHFVFIMEKYHRELHDYGLKKRQPVDLAKYTPVK